MWTVIVYINEPLFVHYRIEYNFTISSMQGFDTLIQIR